jgi:hypothetical protein
MVEIHGIVAFSRALPGRTGHPKSLNCAGIYQLCRLLLKILQFAAMAEPAARHFRLPAGGRGMPARRLNAWYGSELRDTFRQGSGLISQALLMSLTRTNRAVIQPATRGGECPA